MSATPDSTPVAVPTGLATLGVPPGCVEAPGYILDLFDGSAWMTQDGRVTDRWNERGVWPTAECAAEAMRRFLSPNTERSGGEDQR